MTVYESDLPGVGKKFELDLDDGSRLVIITHNTGKREVYRRPSAEADAEKLFDLTDELARRVGTVLEGAYFQPVRSGGIETLLGANTLIEWVTLDESSPVVGQTLGESDIRRETGASVIAIDREGGPVANPGSDTELSAGDTLVALGTRDEIATFQSYVSD